MRTMGMLLLSGDAGLLYSWYQSCTPFMEALTLLMGAGRAGVGGRVSQIAQNAVPVLAKAKKNVRKCMLVV